MRKVVGFHVSSQGGDFILWGYRNRLAGCVEMTMGVDGNTKMTLSDLAFNRPRDESLFSVEPPAGYTVRNKESYRSPSGRRIGSNVRAYSALRDGSFPAWLDHKRRS